MAWRTGWLSDRAAAFLALGRPVITEDTGAGKYLPSESGFRFVSGLDEAEMAANEVLADWPRLSRQARNCAVEIFRFSRGISSGKSRLRWASSDSFAHGAVRCKNSCAILHCKTVWGCYSFPVMADLLKADAAKARLKKIPEWELEKKHIERTFEFDDFSESIDFVNGVAEVAEDEEHHPDIDIRYNKVRLVLSTHSKGGLTELDFNLAERIDTLSE